MAQLTFQEGHDDSLGKLFSISLGTTVVLDLDVKIERAFATVDFLAILVWADVLSVDFFGSPAVMLFTVAILQTFRLLCLLGRFLSLQR